MSKRKGNIVLEPVLVAAKPTPGDRADDQYELFRQQVAARFQLFGGRVLFTTDARNLWQAYLSGIPQPARKHYDCHKCKAFIETYGNLVFVTEVAPHGGHLESPLWGMDVPEFFKRSMNAMRKVIQRAKITGVFVSQESIYGTPQTKEWFHLCAHAQESAIWYYEKHAGMLDYQRAAQLAENFKMVDTALKDYSLPVARDAYNMLDTHSLLRSEKVLSQAGWFFELQSRREELTGKDKDNVTWLMVAQAPDGFVHINGGMLGSLLEDIKAHLPIKDIKKRWAYKMDPTKFQRPQVAAKAGTIKQANKLVIQLGVMSALKRRYATMNDVKTIWQPEPTVIATHIEPKGGFDHLSNGSKLQTRAATHLPSRISETMTFVKFYKKVLPQATQIEIFADLRLGYAAFTTAVDPSAPPILQWDEVGLRNRVCWYFLGGMQDPAKWNLKPGWNKLSAIILRPTMWNPEREYPGFGNGVLFAIQNCKDLQRKGGTGSSIFPETLKSEFHGIRSVIEEHSRQDRLHEWEKGNVAGIFPSEGGEWNIRLRVATAIGTNEYLLDRWD